MRVAGKTLTRAIPERIRSSLRRYAIQTDVYFTYFTLLCLSVMLLRIDNNTNLSHWTLKRAVLTFSADDSLIHSTFSSSRSCRGIPSSMTRNAYSLLQQSHAVRSVITCPKCSQRCSRTWIPRLLQHLYILISDTLVSNACAESRL